MSRDAQHLLARLQVLSNAIDEKIDQMPVWKVKALDGEIEALIAGLDNKDRRVRP